VYPQRGFSPAIRTTISRMPPRGGRSTRAVIRAPIVLPGNQLPIPPENRLRGHKRRDLPQKLPPKALSPGRQPAALGVGQTEPLASQVVVEDTVFLPQVVDDLLLLAVNPACQGDQEK